MSFTEKDTAAWPKELETLVCDRAGAEYKADRLSGIKVDGGCFRVTGDRGSIIIKGAEGRELEFYRLSRTLPRALQPHLPQVFGIFGGWVALEDLPQPLPRERWLADRDVLRVLALLHGNLWGQNAAVADPFRPRWDAAMTEAVLALGLDGGAARALRHLQAEAQPLFAPLCPVQGDANPTNWQLRGDGTPVLIDWERFGLGTPAIDIAVTVPGIGSEDGRDEALAASVYLNGWRLLGLPEPSALLNLARQVQLAKCWNVVEFLAFNFAAVEPDKLGALLARFQSYLMGL